MAIGHLAQLISSMPGWIATTLREPAVDLAASDGYSFHPTDQLLKRFDTTVGLAMLNVPLSSVYGPTADTRWQTTALRVFCYN